MNGESELRAELVRICKKLDDRRLIAAADGNVSCRLGSDRLLITPSGRAKGELDPADLLVVNFAGETISGDGRPSSEIRMHLVVYRNRTDVGALVHAHPPLLTAFSLAGGRFCGRRSSRGLVDYRQRAHRPVCDSLHRRSPRFDRPVRQGPPGHSARTARFSHLWPDPSRSLHAARKAGTRSVHSLLCIHDRPVSSGCDGEGSPRETRKNPVRPPGLNPDRKLKICPRREPFQG